MKKPTRYQHEKQDWNLNNQDIFPHCREAIVKCPLGYPGHRVFWLNASVNKHMEDGLYFDVVVRINHAHFVRNRDTGRHVDDVVGHLWISEKYTVTSRRIDYAKLPQWIKDENEFLSEW